MKSFVKLLNFYNNILFAILLLRMERLLQLSRRTESIPKSSDRSGIGKLQDLLHRRQDRSKETGDRQGNEIILSLSLNQFIKIIKNKY